MGHGASPVHAKLLQCRSDGCRRLLEVVVGDLREKQVVRDVSVGDVVVSVVDSPAVLSVNGLHGRRCEVEVGVVKRLEERAATKIQSMGDRLGGGMVSEDA